MSRQPLAGNRLADPHLRQARQERGWSTQFVAEQVGVSRQFLGNVERRDCRAAADLQTKLARLYSLNVDQLFEPLASVGYTLPPRRGEWALASEAERILGLTGEGLRFLIDKGIIERRGGSSRYQFHWPTLLQLVPDGTLTVSQIAEFDFVLESGLSRDQLLRRLRGRRFRPWPGAAYRVLPADVEALRRELEASPYHSEEGLKRLRESQRAYVNTPAGQRRQAKLIADFIVRRRAAIAECERHKQEHGLLDREDVAERLNVDPNTVSYYSAVGLIDSELHVINGFPFQLYSEHAVRRHRVEFARGLPPMNQRGPDQTKLGVRGRALNEQAYVNELLGKRLLQSGSPAEEAARGRTRHRRKKILAVDARRTVAASSGGKKKGGKAAFEALELAREAIQKKPTLSKRGVMDYVAVKLYGPTAIMLPSGARRPAADADYQMYRVRVKRRLERACRDEGVPPELAHLFKAQ